MKHVTLLAVMGLWHQVLGLYGHRPLLPAVSPWTNANVYRPNQNEEYFVRSSGFKSQIDQTVLSPPVYGNYGSDTFALVGSDSGIHPLFRDDDTTTFKTAAYQFFLRLLCPNEMKNAEEVRFNSRKFVADIDKDYNFVLQLREGNALSDNAFLNLPDWVRVATWRYKQSVKAAFAMFDVMDVDRSGFISRHDFVHWIVDTNRDGVVTVCEEMDHVNKAARLAEQYHDVVQNQDTVLCNCLYDPGFQVPPFIPGSIRATARTVDKLGDDVRGQQTETPEPRNETAAWTEIKDVFSDGDSNASQTRKKNHSSVAVTTDTTHGQTSQRVSAEGNRSQQQHRQEPEQEMTSVSVTSASTTASWITADNRESTTTDFDLVVRGLFKIEG